MNDCLIMFFQETELTRQLLLKLPHLIALDAFIADSEDSAKLDDGATSNVARPESEEPSRDENSAEDSTPTQLGLMSLCKMQFNSFRFRFELRACSSCARCAFFERHLNGHAKSNCCHPPRHHSSCQYRAGRRVSRQ